MSECPQLPATGGSTWVFIAGAVAIVAGMVLLRCGRHPSLPTIVVLAVGLAAFGFWSSPPVSAGSGCPGESTTTTPAAGNAGGTTGTTTVESTTMSTAGTPSTSTTIVPTSTTQPAATTTQPATTTTTTTELPTTTTQSATSTTINPATTTTQPATTTTQPATTTTQPAATTTTTSTTTVPAVAPIARDDTFTATVGGLTFNVFANDDRGAPSAIVTDWTFDAPDGTWSWSWNPATGNVTITGPDGRAPSPGVATLSYTLTNDSGNSTAVATITAG